MSVWSGDFGGHLVRPCCPVRTLFYLLLRHCAQSMPVLAVLCPGETAFCDKEKIKAVVKMLFGPEFYSVLTGQFGIKTSNCRVETLHSVWKCVARYH